MKQSTLVVLHGWTKDQNQWQPLIKNLGHQGCQVINPVLPGFGQKELTKVWDLQKYSDWLGKYLTDKKINQYTLLGYSNGGRIGAYYASQRPSGLKKLILISSAGMKKGLNLKKTVFWPLAKMGRIVFSLPGLKHLQLSARRWLYRLAGEKDYYQADKNLAKTMVNLISIDLNLSLSKIRVPTLILWGGKDKTTPLREGLIFKKKIRNSKLVLFPDAGHDLPYHQPKAIAREILIFLKA